MQIIYSLPYGRRHVTYQEIKQLAEAIEKPPYRLTPELLWRAYEQLDESKVRGAGPQKLLTNIVSLIRFTVGQSDILEPFPDMVERRFEHWLAQQESAGRTFTPEQMKWLRMIKDQIARSLSIEMDDFDKAPFYERGGRFKVYTLFGDELTNVLQELTEVLAA